MGSMEVRAHNVFDLLAVVELDSFGTLEWIVEWIEGSIPFFSAFVVVSNCVLCL